ncbi:MAG TPA: hypothetical protein VH950_13420 [Gaiellaceae bacterium]|jgi:hypothetical protein
MSDDEAKGILRSEFLKLRALGYEALVDRLEGKKEQVDVTGSTGADYHVELEAFWDNREERQLRVVASIDDGGLRAFLPFTESFSIDPSGHVTDHSEA